MFSGVNSSGVIKLLFPPPAGRNYQLVLTITRLILLKMAF